MSMKPLAWTAISFVFLASPVGAQTTGAPRMHAKPISLLHGAVTSERVYPAYAAALGASTSPMGAVQCLYNNGGGGTIRRTTIFRVETASRYFDLSKLCTNDLSGYDGPGHSSAWRAWQHLRIGEAVVMRIVKHLTRLSVPRCHRLGMLSKSVNPFGADTFLGNSAKAKKDERIYESHCTYNVAEAYVRVRLPSYSINGPTGTYHVDRWTFRIVDSGLRSHAKSTQVGDGYSASLPPPW